MRYCFKHTTMWLPISLTIVVLLNFIYLNTNEGYKMYKFGERIDGDILSYRNRGVLPLFKPIYKVKIEPHRQDVDKNLTLVTAEVQNKHTEITISFDRPTQTVTFRCKYPFIRTMYEIKGYSLPKGLSNASLPISNLQSLINEFNLF